MKTEKQRKKLYQGRFIYILSVITYVISDKSGQHYSSSLKPKFYSPEIRGLAFDLDIIGE